MKKSGLYIAIAVVILVLLGGAAFLGMNKKSPSETIVDNQQNQIVTGAVTENSVQSTLKDLLAKGVAQKCSFTDKMENLDMSGTMYISGGKMRGDFTNTIEGKPMSSHMIFENNTAYNWSDGQPNGMMFKMDPADTKTQGQARNNQSFDPNKVVDYRCSPWIVDNSLFVPPANVKFSDLSKMMAPTNAAGTPNTPNMCAACENLSGDAKQQCLTALKCS